MSQAGMQNQFLVGVYDNAGNIADALIEALGAGNVLDFSYASSSPWHSEGCTTELFHDDQLNPVREYRSTKHEFFYVCRHVVVKIDAVDSLSFLTGGILALLRSEIDSLTVVTEFDIEPLLKLGFESEVVAVTELRARGSFVIQDTFVVSDFIQRITGSNKVGQH